MPDPEAPASAMRSETCSRVAGLKVKVTRRAPIRVDGAGCCRGRRRRRRASGRASRAPSSGSRPIRDSRRAGSATGSRATRRPRSSGSRGGSRRRPFDRRSRGRVGRPPRRCRRAAARSPAKIQRKSMRPWRARKQEAEHADVERGLDLHAHALDPPAEPLRRGRLLAGLHVPDDRVPLVDLDAVHHDPEPGAARVSDDRDHLGRRGREAFAARHARQALQRAAGDGFGGLQVRRQDRRVPGGVGLGARRLRSRRPVIGRVNHDERRAAVEDQLVRRGPDLLGPRRVALGFVLAREPRVRDPDVLGALAQQHLRDRRGQARLGRAVRVVGVRGHPVEPRARHEAGEVIDDVHAVLLSSLITVAPRTVGTLVGRCGCGSAASIADRRSTITSSSWL